MTVVMNHCADALESSDPAILDNDTLSQHTLTLQEKNPRAVALVDVTRDWLNAIRNPKCCLGGKETVKGLLQIYVPMVLLPFVPLVRVFQVLALPFQPKNWDLRKFLWAFKLTAGYVALVVMEVYWDAYAQFFIETPEQNAKHHTLIGWQLLTYAMTFTPTVEGTVKKGIVRVIGTLLGGFFGWLAIVVSSGSTSNDAPINPYGFVAWITITSSVMAYFLAFDSGLNAYMGIDYDHGYIGAYLIATQALVAFMVYHGEGGRGELAVNRIVATVIGVLTSVSVALIPPYVRGGNPVYVRAYYESIRDAYLAFLRDLIKEAGRTDDQDAMQFDDEYDKELGKDMKKKRSLASFLLKDSDHLRCFPFMRVDERIRPAIERLTLAESFLSLCVDLAQDDNSCIKHIKSQLEEALVVWENDREIPGISKSPPKEDEETARQKSVETRSLGHFMSKFGTDLKAAEEVIVAIEQGYEDLSHLRQRLNNLFDLHVSGAPYGEDGGADLLPGLWSDDKKTK